MGYNYGWIYQFSGTVLSTLKILFYLNDLLSVLLNSYVSGPSSHIPLPTFSPPPHTHHRLLLRSFICFTLVSLWWAVLAKSQLFFSPMLLLLIFFILFFWNSSYIRVCGCVCVFTYTSSKNHIFHFSLLHSG